METLYTILLLDSGIGGFSILQKIKKDYPQVNYIYLLDNHSFPYGNKKESFIIDRSIKLIARIQKKYSIHLVILACNTISTIALSILRKKFYLPILGVIPEIKNAINTTKNNIVGLIATEATIKNIRMQNMIKKYSSSCNIQIIATNELAIMAEKKIREIPISYIKLKKILHSWVILPSQPDTVILGCTHFNFLKAPIQNILDQQVIFLDSLSNIFSKIKNIIHATHYKKITQNNIFLYSKKNKTLKKLLLHLKTYNFTKIEKISI